MCRKRQIKKSTVGMQLIMDEYQTVLSLNFSDNFKCVCLEVLEYHIVELGEILEIMRRETCLQPDRYRNAPLLAGNLIWE